MKFLAKLKDRWTDFQDRQALGTAVAVLALDGGRLFSFSGAAEIECDSSSPDAVAKAALSLGLEVAAQVILLLPPGHFSTSEHQFANLNRSALLRALYYQQDELFPGMEALVVTAACSPRPSLALWMRQRELEYWQQAFALAGLKLLAIGPSNLIRQYLGETGFKSLDADSMFEATVDQLGNLTGWSLKEGMEREGRKNSSRPASPWKGFKGRLKIRRPDYLFLLEKRGKQPRFGLWLGLAAVTVGLLVTYAVLPIAQQLNLRTELEQRVADLARQADDVLTLREQVLALEERLAPALNYPKIKIGSLLILLDKNLPKQSWLTSMWVKESNVEIEGVSPDPSRVIERLSVRPEFSEVAFSRAIQQDPRLGRSEGKSSFGIRLKLAGIDFDGWRQSVKKSDE
ncbi:MAG: PilN domain-containing protein [Gammaproteobacteria bacterium]|nr:PilN domain-containing protein [Gammaproteobacteria bacterium]